MDLIGGSGVPHREGEQSERNFSGVDLATPRRRARFGKRLADAKPKQEWQARQEPRVATVAKNP